MNKWEQIKLFVNTNEYFTRKDYINSKIYSSTFSSIDQYILLMKNSGFIEKLGIGKYKRLIIISENVTLNLINKLAYNSEERIKYFRKLKLEKLNNI